MILMVIGGSPGSTAGGIKTTTFAVLILSTLSVIKNRHSVHAFQRNIDEDTPKRACALSVVYIGVAAVSTVVLCALQTFRRLLKPFPP
jgi:trk system potassium uptake protein TrkH